MKNKWNNIDVNVSPSEDEFEVKIKGAWYYISTNLCWIVFFLCCTYYCTKTTRQDACIEILDRVENGPPPDWIDRNGNKSTRK